MSGRFRGRQPHPIAAAAAALVVSAAFFACTVVATPLRGDTVLVILWCLLLAGVVAAAAWRLGPVFGVPMAIAAALAIDSFYIAPYRSFDSRDWVNYPVTSMYLAIGVLVGVVLELTRRRAAKSESARSRLAEEQAALRRVATLIARGVPPEEVFAAVAVEMRDLMRADATRILRFEPDGTGTLLAGTSSEDQLGRRGSLERHLATAGVLQTGRAARVDGDGPAAPEVSTASSVQGPSPSSVASPVLVNGRPWGAIVVSSGEGPLPAETELRMVEFTELLAIAIANAESRAQLAASRARVVLAGDEARRRLERNLHDGVQQRVVSLALRLRRTEKQLSPEDQHVRVLLSETVDSLNQVADEVREVAHGIHPAILTQGGLGPALRALARSSVIPVEVNVGFNERLPDALEAAAYYVAAEALANTAKHALASRAAVTVELRDGLLLILIYDDGIGGADPGSGSGLTGLRDRVEALGGSLVVRSPHGEGTALDVALPLAEMASPVESPG